MARTFTTYQGKRVTPYMKYALGRINSWLTKHYKLTLTCNDAIRTDAEQEAIFRARYVTAGNVNGRKVYDMRYWQGRWWYRISAAGTVAVPGTSNHQIQGKKAAVDIADSGRDAGITVKGSKRGKAFRKAIKRGGELSDLGLTNEGDSFGEGWHFTFKNIDKKVPGSDPKPAGNKKSSKPKFKLPKPSAMLKWKWTGIQRMLKADFGYRGAIDNIPGAGTKKAMRRFMSGPKNYSVRANGWKLAIKALFNKNDVKAIQQWLRDTGRDKNLVVDGIPGDKTHAAWNKAEAENAKAYSWVK